MSESDEQGICLQFPRASDAAHRSDHHPTKFLFRSPSLFSKCRQSWAWICLCVIRTRTASSRHPFRLAYSRTVMAGACTSCGEQKFVRIWTGIAAAALDRFVSQELVWSDRDILTNPASSDVAST